MSQWISVKERLPEMGQKVMAFGPDCRYIIADFIGPRFITDAGIGFRIDQITHWQPLPEPPEKEDGKT